MIKQPTDVYNVLRQIFKSGIFNRTELDTPAVVIGYCYSVKETVTADWITNNKQLYLQGLLEGFCIDNSQENQLRDIKTKINL